MPTVLSEPKNLGDVLLYEEENYFYSRDEITIAQGELISIGQVLSYMASTGEYVALDITLSEEPGVDRAAAIAIRAIDAAENAIETVAIVRHAIVKRDGLVWPGDMSAVQLAAGVEQLQALGVLIRR